MVVPKCGIPGAAAGDWKLIEVALCAFNLRQARLRADDDMKAEMALWDVWVVAGLDDVLDVTDD